MPKGQTASVNGPRGRPRDFAGRQREGKLSNKRGTAREYAIRKRCWSLGYMASRVSGSGKRISSGARANGIPGDVLAIAPRGSVHPHLLIEVGGSAKSVQKALKELEGAGLRGFVSVVARCIGRKWTFTFLEQPQTGSNNFKTVSSNSLGGVIDYYVPRLF